MTECNSCAISACEHDAVPAGLQKHKASCCMTSINICSQEAREEAANTSSAEGFILCVSSAGDTASSTAVL